MSRVFAAGRLKVFGDDGDGAVVAGIVAAGTAAAPLAGPDVGSSVPSAEGPADGTPVTLDEGTPDEVGRMEPEGASVGDGDDVGRDDDVGPRVGPASAIVELTGPSSSDKGGVEFEGRSVSPPPSPPPNIDATPPIPASSPSPNIVPQPPSPASPDAAPSLPHMAS